MNKCQEHDASKRQDINGIAAEFDKSKFANSKQISLTF